MHSRANCDQVANGSACTKMVIPEMLSLTPKSSKNTGGVVPADGQALVLASLSQAVCLYQVGDGRFCFRISPDVA
jgi:hypothetical protein